MTNFILRGTEWPSGLRRRLRRRRRWFDTSAVGGIFLRASHGVRRTSAKTYGLPIRNSAKHTHVYQPAQSKIYCSLPTPNGPCCRGLSNKNKKKKTLYQFVSLILYHTYYNSTETVCISKFIFISI